MSQRQRHPNCRLSPSQLLATLCLTLAMLGSSGCIVPHIGRALEGRHGPIYQIEDRSTLVFVEVDDQAQYLMGDPRIPRLVAARTGNRLVHDGRLSDVVDHDRIYDMAARMGSQFYEDRPPIDAIGRHVGAEQVIIINIESARLRQEPGLLEPQILSRVRVIQTDPYRRLFPVSADLPEDPRFQPEGYEVVSELPQSLDDEMPPERMNRVTQLMGEVVARDVSRLFIRWDEDDERHRVGNY